MTQKQVVDLILATFRSVGVPYIDPCTHLQVGDCSICQPEVGDPEHPAATLAQTNAIFSWNAVTQVGNIPNTPILTFNSTTGDLTWIPGNGTAPVSFNVRENSTEVLTTGPITIDGTTFATGSTLQAVLEALALAEHPSASLTNTLAPFSWNPLTQVGNIPLQDTLTLGAGSAIFTPGNGDPTTTIPYLDNTTTVLTTGAITVGSTVNAIGTTLQSILSQLSLNNSFILNAGVSALNTDNGLGTQTIALGQKIHFWSPDSSILFDVNTNDVSLLVQDFLTPASLTVQGTLYPAGTSVLAILAALTSGSGGASNLSLINSTSVSLEVANSNGTGVVLPAATTFLAGLMTAGQLITLNSLVTLTGLPTNSLNFGTFTGSTISDNLALKPILQSLETSVETKQSKIQYKKDGVNVGTLGEVTTVDLIGANITATLLLGTLTLSVTGGGGGLNRTVVTPTGGHTGSVVFGYYGTIAPTFNKDTSSIWSITVPTGTELVSADIYSPAPDNPGSNLTINISTGSTVYNQGITTMLVPFITGLALGAGSGTVPANYAPTTGATNLLSSLNTIPVTGDIQILINNFNNANALGVGATLVKLIL